MFKWGRPRRTPPELLHQLTVLTERIEHVDTAIEAIAIEVERVSEAQRFTAKLLAERGAAPILDRGRPSDVS